MLAGLLQQIAPPMHSNSIERPCASDHPGIAPTDLWAVVLRRTRDALASGALQPIETTTRAVDQSGIRFIVRVASNLRRKDAARRREIDAAKRTGSRINPFLPYEAAMFVADLSPTHVCLLNKFNVLEHHLLIVTRAYADQETLIDKDDFVALCRCMAQIDGLGLYNAGSDAGASQPHKHLQLIPLPLSEAGPPVPIAPALDILPAQAPEVTTVPAFPFRHSFSRLEPTLFESPDAAATEVWETYRRLLAVMGIGESGDGDGRQTQAYNLLLTRSWMLLVPRSRAAFAGVSISALNFAGSMFVRSEDELRVIAEAGPLAVLAGVSCPRGETPPAVRGAETTGTDRPA
jgi:ATP adenylyltransferase (5'',5''''''-P-1,P-4-tetraphosphate phosphorylase II)